MLRKVVIIKFELCRNPILIFFFVWFSEFIFGSKSIINAYSVIVDIMPEVLFYQ